MVIAGHEGYLDLSLIYEGRHAGLNWANLAEMRAVQSNRLVALGYDEWRATVETPIALLKVAALAYPERFADLDIAAEEVAFYREVYGMDEAEALARPRRWPRLRHRSTSASLRSSEPTTSALPERACRTTGP